MLESPSSLRTREYLANCVTVFPAQAVIHPDIGTQFNAAMDGLLRGDGRSTHLTQLEEYSLRLYYQVPALQHELV